MLLQVASYMRAVLRTLAQCHSHRILHRDIKPSNFMLLNNSDRAPLKAIGISILPSQHAHIAAGSGFMQACILRAGILHNGAASPILKSQQALSLCRLRPGGIL